MIVKNLDELISQFRYLEHPSIDLDKYIYFNFEFKLSLDNYIFPSQEVDFYEMISYMSNCVLDGLETVELIEILRQIRTSGFEATERRLDEYSYGFVNEMEALSIKYELSRNFESIWLDNLKQTETISPWIEWHKLCYEACIVEFLYYFSNDPYDKPCNILEFETDFITVLNLLVKSRANMIVIKAKGHRYKTRDEREQLIKKCQEDVLEDLCSFIKSKI